MFEDLLGTGEYYDFPSFEVALFSLLLSFVLSAVIGLTYRLTFSGNSFPLHFFQAIVLSSMVSSMVIMAVGNNLAAGFGIIGAIAIIRFRTLVRDPRNIIFIFASLSVGIATGVYGYAIAIAGSLLFCVIAILLHYSPYGSFGQRFYELAITVSEISDVDEIHSYFKEIATPLKVTRYRKLDPEPGYRFTFQITILSSSPDTDSIFSTLSSRAVLRDIRLSPAEEEVL